MIERRRGRPPQTECYMGHDLTGPNRMRDGRCRTCERLNARKRRARKRLGRVGENSPEGKNA